MREAKGEFVLGTRPTVSSIASSLGRVIPLESKGSHRDSDKSQRRLEVGSVTREMELV